MVPYICIYITIIVLCICFSYFGKNNPHSKKVCLFTIGIMLSVLTGCRASTVGYDTLNYVKMFKAYAGNSDMRKIYVSYLEPGYSLLSNVIIKMGGDIHTLFIVSSLFIVFTALIFLYRYSKSFYFSVFILSSFPYFFSSMDILRFFLGVSIWLWAIKFAIEKKPIKYILITLVAAQFHKMIYVFILFYLFNKDKSFNRYFTINLVAIFTSNFIVKNIIRRDRPIDINLIIENGFSFPSGHSMVSFAFYGFIIYYVYCSHLSKLWKTIIISILTLLVLMIGLSRIYLGVHYASDVIGGFVLALVYLIIFIKYIYKKEKKANK